MNVKVNDITYSDVSLNLNEWLTDDDGFISFGPAPAISAGNGFYMRRDTEIVNGVTIEGTRIGMFVAQPPYQQWVQLQVRGTGKLYWYEYVNGITTDDTDLKMFNDQNKLLLDYEGFVGGMNMISNTEQFVPDTTIDFRPYISQINS